MDVTGTDVVCHAPDIFRETPSWGHPPHQPIVMDEGGAFTGFFTNAGFYRFDFSFVNEFMETAGHPDIYLLIDSWEAENLKPVPEPTTLLLFGVGLIGWGTWHRRRSRR